MVYLVKSGQNTPIEPSLADGVISLIQLASFTYSKRLDGNEEISFDAQKSKNVDDFEVGKTYFVYADKELTKQLPCTFTLQNLFLKFDGREQYTDMRTYSVQAVSIEEKLRRKKISGTYRNIKFKTLLTRLIDKYRKFVPEISSDYSFIEDLDYTFVLWNKKNLFLADIMEIIRGMGYQCFLRPDFKIQAGNKSYLPAFTIDLDRDYIGSQWVGIQRNDNSKITLKYKELPITSVICKAGFSDSGTLTAKNAITNKESNYDLLYKVNIDDNFILEAFNSDILEGFDYSSQSGIGWFKRYAVYNSPLQFPNFQLWETSIQILDHKEAYFLGVNDGNRLEGDFQLAAFYFQNGELYACANGIKYPTNKILKKFLSLDVVSVSTDLFSATLASVADLAIGDIVSITGIGTGLELAIGKITNISGLTVTFDRTISPGIWNNTVKLIRSTTYELRILINKDGNTEFLVRDSLSGIDFELLGEYYIVYPANSYITAFNCYEEPTPTIDNGVWEVGGYAIDYFFLDKATFIYAYDDSNKKIVLSKEDQSDIVSIQAVINNITKNGKEIGQLQFIAPSYTKLVLNNPLIPPTTTKIPLAFAKEDSLQVGMRVLINNEASLITNFYQDSAQGYIEISPALTTPPSPLTQVWIHTSIPADNTNFFIEYIPSREIMVRDEAPAAALAKWGIREQDIQLTEYTDIAELAERLQIFITEEISPSISGTINFKVNMSNCYLETYYNTSILPTIGEFIKVTESIQGINQATAMIQAYTLQALPDEGIFNLVIELGEFIRPEVYSALKRLERKIGIIQDSDDSMNYNLPSIKREVVTAQELAFNRTSSPGYAFLSGVYRYNYSGNDGKVYINTELLLAKTIRAGYEFLSGQYLYNYSGAQDHITYNIAFNANLLVFNGNPIVYTITQ